MGEITTEEDKMANITVSYFSKLFKTNGVGDMDNVLSRVEQCIAEDMNRSPLAPYSMEDILESLKIIGLTKATRNDGFSAIIFQHFWDIIGDDVNTFCLHIPNTGMSLEACNFTNIVLIPKMQKPTSLSNFRPVSLCTILYKLILKSFANRFRLVLDACIGETQSAFVLRRLISDNILLAYEILHSFKGKRMGRKGKMTLKLDMSKAYDRVEWAFLKKMVLTMGFVESWVNFIMSSLSTVSYSVILNGILGPSFRASRGLR